MVSHQLYGLCGRTPHPNYLESSKGRAGSFPCSPEPRLLLVNVVYVKYLADDKTDVVNATWLSTVTCAFGELRAGVEGWAGTVVPI